MILIISTCSEPIHELEFVKPLENTIKKNKKEFKTKHYSKIKPSDINKASKIIISGTSLQDDKFIKELSKFKWIKNLDKPLLGICAGHQIISLTYGAKLKSKTEIGYYFEFFDKSFLSLEGEHEVYHLHNNYTTLPRNFKEYTKSKIPQAIKHITKPTYGVLFHPEVRNKKLIENFINS